MRECLGGIVPPEVNLSISRVRNDVVISWPANLTGFTLEVSHQFPAGSWDTVPVPAGHQSVQLPLADGPAYYRLRW
jgi:hypothetical protein